MFFLIIVVLTDSPTGARINISTWIIKAITKNVRLEAWNSSHFQIFRIQSGDTVKSINGMSPSTDAMKRTSSMR